MNNTDYSRDAESYSFGFLLILCKWIASEYELFLISEQLNRENVTHLSAVYTFLKNKVLYNLNFFTYFFDVGRPVILNR